VLEILVVLVELAVVVVAAAVSFRKAAAKLGSLERKAAARLVCEQDPVSQGSTASQQPRNGGLVFAQV
jgi:hypothetical protein